MKKLVMSALLFGVLAQGATGCIFVSDDDGDDTTSGTASVTATWSIFDGENAAGCPVGAGTAAVNALRAGDSEPFVDLYNCEDGSGDALDLPAGDYTVWVDLTDDSGATLFAQSESVAIGLSDGEHAQADFTIDGFNGFWDVGWSLLDEGGAPITCADVNQDGVGVLSTNTDTTTGYDSLWNCTDGEDPSFVTTDPVPVGGYVIVLSLIDPATQGSLGDSVEIQEVITHGNEFVDLGVVLFLELDERFGSVVGGLLVVAARQQQAER